MGEPRTDGDSPSNFNSFSSLPADFGKDLHQTFPGPPPDFGKTSPDKLLVFIVSSLATSFKAIPSDHVEEQLECNEHSAALSSLSPPVCLLSSPPPTNAHVFDVRTWHRSHQAAKFSPPHVCVTPKHDVRLSLFFVARTQCSRTPALYSAVLPSRPISHNILRFDQPMDTSQTSHPIQESHSNFNVAKKNASRKLEVHMEPAMTCKAQKNAVSISWRGTLCHAPKKRKNHIQFTITTLMLTNPKMPHQ